MPHVEQLFGDFADISKVNGREINASHVKTADALLVRSITPVNQGLLDNSSVSFVGTATIGVDHLDTQWLSQRQICWANAAGCNASAVAQYVLSGVAFWLKKTGKKLCDIKVGIVGAGNVGSQLAGCLQKLAVDYCLNDPPLERTADRRHFVGMDEILKCDVITFHVPITRHGDEATWHLVDKLFLAQIQPGQLLINAARGEVIDNQALYQYLQLDQTADVILDVFENEPQINLALANRCLLATPHIAGHTLEGKSRGSFMVYQALCEHFGITQTVDDSALFPPLNQFDSSLEFLDELECLLQIYNIKKDSERLLSGPEDHIGEHFDGLRKNYASFFNPLPRRDFSGWRASHTVPKSVQALMV